MVDYDLRSISTNDEKVKLNQSPLFTDEGIEFIKDDDSIQLNDIDISSS